MSLHFHAAHSWRLLQRRSRAAVSILIVSAIATIGLAFAIAGFLANSSDLSSLSEQIVVTVFLHPDADTLDAVAARRELLSLPEIQSVKVVYPHQAREEFTQRYGTPIDSLLPENPFPISIVAELNPDFRTPLGVQSTVNKAKRIPVVDDAVYRSSYVEAVESRIRSSASLAIAAGSILLIIFIVTLYTTLRSGLGLTRQEATVLHLTGARRLFIAAPYLLFGIGLCTVGIGTGAALTVLLRSTMNSVIPWIVAFPQVALLYAVAGMVIASMAICIFTVLRTASATS